MSGTTARKLGLVERLQIVRCIQVVELVCRCRAGVYETIDDIVLTVVDDPHDDCPDRSHQADFVIAEVHCGGLTPAPHGEAA